MSRRDAREEASILALFGVAVATAALVLLLIVDAAAYLVAASRAQAAADAAALAAIVVADRRAGAAGDPTREAARVAVAADARLDTCVCAVGARVVEVAVSVPVHGLVVPRLAARRVTAVATAELRPGPPRAGTPAGPPHRQEAAAAVPCDAVGPGEPPPGRLVGSTGTRVPSLESAACPLAGEPP